MNGQMRHGGAVGFDSEIQFETPFGYLFRRLAEDTDKILPADSDTVEALEELSEAMADPGEPGQPATEYDSSRPAIMTYFGQFIDHDITANTDRDGTLITSINEDAERKGLSLVDPDRVTGRGAVLTNGRRPHLDLDSVYGDGPPLVAANGSNAPQTRAGELYDDELYLKVRSNYGYLDLRRDDRDARIADKRNDENIILSQFQATMIRFHNAVAEGLAANNADGPTPAHRYARARQLVRWCYTYIVVNEYLPSVCAPAVVEDVLLNGPRHFGPGSRGVEAYMPLEFSVAAFRFAHSMIRPFYQLNGQTELPVLHLLQPSKPANKPGNEALEDAGDGNKRLKPNRVVSWSRFVPCLGGEPQPARKIDPFLAKGLDRLDEGLGGEQVDDNLKHLARSNLLRGLVLRMPTGQAVARTLGAEQLSENDIADGKAVSKAIQNGRFADKTPLWYYILQEASVQQNGDRLGAVGSRIVAETLIGLIKNDPNSHLNNPHERPVTPHGVEVLSPRRERVRISTLADLIEFAGAPV